MPIVKGWRPCPSFDQILLRSGYRGEYCGKYHRPYKFALDYPRLNSPYPDTPGSRADVYRDAMNIRQMTSIYYGMVAEVDVRIGKVLDRLDELDLAENTLVHGCVFHGGPNRVTFGSNGQTELRFGD